jgi:hypothetical protein
MAKRVCKVTAGGGGMLDSLAQSEEGVLQLNKVHENYWVIAGMPLDYYSFMI